MDTGFTVEWHEGAASVFSSDHAPARTPSRVQLAASRHVRLVFLGRLDYRADLLARLGDEARLRPEQTLTDAEAVLLHYEQAGPDGFATIEGEYALTLWDDRRCAVFGARDPMGGFPLYYLTREGLAAFSTSIRPLLKWLPSAEIDREFLADTLVAGGPVSERPTERCSVNGVSRVGAGSYVEVRPEGGSARPVRFWDWTARIEEPTSHDDVEAVADQYRERIVAAVSQRLRGSPASHLSGGLDSTAIAYWARDILDRSGRDSPLPTISVIYDKLPVLARERPYVEAAVQGRSGFEPHLVQGDQVLDFDAFFDTPPLDEPYPGLWRMAMDRAAARAASAAGATTLLTGLGGDEFLAVQPYHLADLLRAGKIRTAWAEAGIWASAYRSSAWNFFYPFGVANLFPVWSRQGLGTWLHPRGELAKANEWRTPGWLVPEYARTYDVRGRIAGSIRGLYARTRPVALSLALSSIERRTGNAMSWHTAVDRGLICTHPFLDARVIRLGLGIQAVMRPVPQPIKPVLHAAVRDLIPRMLLDRRSKGHFNEVFYLGLARNLPALERLARSPAVEALNMIDPGRFRVALGKAALGAVGVRPLHFLTTMLTLLQWVNQFDRLREPMSPHAPAVWPDPVSTSHEPLAESLGTSG